MTFFFNVREKTLYYLNMKKYKCISKMDYYLNFIFTLLSIGVYEIKISLDNLLENSQTSLNV